MYLRYSFRGRRMVSWQPVDHTPGQEEIAAAGSHHAAESSFKTVERIYSVYVVYCRFVLHIFVERFQVVVKTFDICSCEC